MSFELVHLSKLAILEPYWDTISYVRSTAMNKDMALRTWHTKWPDGGSKYYMEDGSVNIGVIPYNIVLESSGNQGGILQDLSLVFSDGGSIYLLTSEQLIYKSRLMHFYRLNSKRHDKYVFHRYINPNSESPLYFVTGGNVAPIFNRDLLIHGGRDSRDQNLYLEKLDYPEYGNATSIATASYFQNIVDAPGGLDAYVGARMQYNTNTETLYVFDKRSSSADARLYFYAWPQIYGEEHFPTTLSDWNYVSVPFIEHPGADNYNRLEAFNVHTIGGKHIVTLCQSTASGNGSGSYTYFVDWNVYWLRKHMEEVIFDSSLIRTGKNVEIESDINPGTEIGDETYMAGASPILQVETSGTVTRKEIGTSFQPSGDDRMYSFDLPHVGALSGLVVEKLDAPYSGSYDVIAEAEYAHNPTYGIITFASTSSLYSQDSKLFVSYNYYNVCYATAGSGDMIVSPEVYTTDSNGVKEISISANTDITGRRGGVKFKIWG